MTPSRSAYHYTALCFMCCSWFILYSLEGDMQLHVPLCLYTVFNSVAAPACGFHRKNVKMRDSGIFL